jgi:hypothetical protein
VILIDALLTKQQMFQFYQECVLGISVLENVIKIQKNIEKYKFLAILL